MIPDHRTLAELGEQELPSVYLVVMPKGGIFSVELDAERAREAARNIGGVLAVAPLVEDYRNEALMVAQSKRETLLAAGWLDPPPAANALRAEQARHIADVDRQWCANIEAAGVELEPAVAATITQLRALIRTVECYGTGYRWRHPDGRELLLHPAEVDVFVSADHIDQLEALRTERDELRHTIARLKQLLDGGAAIAAQRDALLAEVERLRTGGGGHAQD